MLANVGKRGFVDTLSALRTTAAWNKGFFSNIIYVRHFRLCTSVWFTTGIEAVHGRCRRLWTVSSDLVRCDSM